MQVEGTMCCAVSEITDLCDYTDGKLAMLDFCRAIQSDGDSHYYDDYDDDDDDDYLNYPWRHTESVGTLAKPSAFYTFTAVVRFKNALDANENVSYGPKFKKYIEDNELGTVVEGPARPNRVNHPDHVVKVYIWAPSEKNLKSWWARNRKPESSVKAKR